MVLWVKVRLMPSLDFYALTIVVYSSQSASRLIICAEDVRQGKPEPEIYLKALAALNARCGNGKPIEAADCVVIEDSKEGIRGARRAVLGVLALHSRQSCHGRSVELPNHVQRA